MQSIFIGLALALICTTVGLLVLAMRTFYPKHRLVALGCLLAGGGLFIYQFIRLRILILQEDRIWFNVVSEYSLYAFTMVGALFFLYIFTKFIVREPSPLKDLSPAEISKLVSQDQENLIYLNKTLERLATKTQA